MNDQETSLYYYRARYYDAEIGRFISEDPLGFKAGINFYAYVNNNPINFNDPMGRFGACVACFGIETIDQRDVGVSIMTTVISVAGGGISPLETRLVENAFFGNGADFSLTPGETSRLANFPDPRFSPEFDLGIGRLSGDPSIGSIDRFDFDSQEISLRDNFFDNLFDPNEDIIENRTLMGEFGTRFGNSLMNNFGGQPFNIFPASAAGGFVLYPNKINTNTLTRIYSK